MDDKINQLSKISEQKFYKAFADIEKNSQNKVWSINESVGSTTSSTGNILFVGGRWIFIPKHTGFLLFDFIVNCSAFSSSSKGWWTYINTYDWYDSKLSAQYTNTATAVNLFNSNTSYVYVPNYYSANGIFQLYETEFREVSLTRQFTRRFHNHDLQYDGKIATWGTEYTNSSNIKSSAFHRVVAGYPILIEFYYSTQNMVTVEINAYGELT